MSLHQRKKETLSFTNLYLGIAGLLFLIFPWSPLWGDQPLVAMLPWLQSPWVKGCISGFGILHLLVVFYVETLLHHP